MDKLTPRPAQIERIEAFINEPTKAGLLADEMGVGKTLVAVEIALRFERTLTIGVKDTFGQFAELFEAQSDGTQQLRRLDSTKGGRQALADMLAGKPGHYFAGSQFLTTQDWRSDRIYDEETGRTVWDTMAKTGAVKTRKAKAGEIGPRELPVAKTVSTHLGLYRKMKPLDALVFDEVHVIQNRKSSGFRTVKTIKSEYKLALSGTWYGNKFDGAWAVARWLWPDLIDGSFWRWKAEWCETEDVYVGKDETRERVIGEKQPGAFVASLPLYFRAEAEPLPPSIDIFVNLTPKQREQYTQLEEDLMLWVGENPLVVDLPATLRQRLRTASLGEMNLTEDGDIFFDLDCASSKITALHGILNGYWGGTERALIGMDSKRFANVTAERMRQAGERVALWTGDTTSKQRDEIKAAFLAGEVQYIVNTIASMSTGLDGFQRVCSKMVLLNELDGNEAVNAQYVRRLFRPGRVGDYELVKILANDTLDAGVYGANLARSLANRTTMRLAA